MVRIKLLYAPHPVEDAAFAGLVVNWLDFLATSDTESVDSWMPTFRLLCATGLVETCVAGSIEFDKLHDEHFAYVAGVESGTTPNDIAHEAGLIVAKEMVRVQQDAEH